jgi:hypothetical protein
MPPVVPREVHNDFNGDGLSDLLWRSSSGIITNWISTSDASFYGNSANFLAQLDPAWKIAGTGDFNGDGLTDMLWRSDSGLVTDWLATPNGGFYGNSVNFLAQLDAGWHIVGTGDFNGDGKSDILWRSAGGLTTDWLAGSNGSFYGNAGNFLSQQDTGWHVADTGDFNGDGFTDILWYKDDGTVTDWLGQENGGFAVNSSIFNAQVGVSWHVAATGDFNGDGMSDILWQSDSGLLTDWIAQSNGGFYGNSVNFLSQQAETSRVVETGDFNGDGFTDLLWRSADGRLADWFGRPDGGFTLNPDFQAQIDNAWQTQPANVFLQATFHP